MFEDVTVIEAAGGVVGHSFADGIRIAVIRRKRHGDEWALPKGKRAPGETWHQTALREVSEEIGLSCEVTGVAGATAYLADGRPKVVLYWRMRFEGAIPPFKANDEVVEVAWLSPAEALRRLTHAEEANVIRQAFPGSP